jgi:Gram-negative bacterial TonB protein C-terminal
VPSWIIEHSRHALRVFGHEEMVNVIFRARLMLSTVIAVSACFVALTGEANAQSWQWQVVVHQANHAPMDAHSRVVLSNREISLAYTVRVDQADVPITTCQAQVGDIANASAVNSADNPFLYVVFKPGRAADCRSGKQPIMIAPISNNADAKSAVDAINRACCSAPVAAAKPVQKRPQKSVAALPTSSPAPRPSPPANPIVDDWVESQGLFNFVRIRNRGAQPVTIAPATVENCRSVVAGCGAFRGQLAIAPGATATLLAVMSGNAASPAAFAYEYIARSGAMTTRGSGSWRKRAGSPVSPLSEQEIGSAESVAVAGLAPPAPQRPVPADPSGPRQPQNEAVHLLSRGTSRLAIGQTGSALLRVHVSGNGTPLNVAIVNVSNRAITPAAIETAVSSTYSPAIQNGRRVEADYVVEFRFNGDDPALAGVPLWKRSPLPAASPSPGPIVAVSASPKAVPTASPSPKPAPTASPSPAPAPATMGAPAPAAT